MSTKKDIALAIVTFLKSEVEGEALDSDGIEGLEVAIQCLETAYGLEGSAPSEVDLQTLLNQPGPSVLTDEQKAAAEQYKIEGNEYMKKNMFQDAVGEYTKAIMIDNNNAVFYGNRAAAYTKLNENQLAISDCKKAIEIDPTYSKAYGRIGLVYMNEHEYAKAKESYQKAVELEPENTTYKSNLELATERLLSGADQAASTPTNPLAGMDIGSLLSNPAVMNMAQSFMQNPQMQNMFANMMGGAPPPPPNPTTPPEVPTAPTGPQETTTAQPQVPTGFPLPPGLDFQSIMNATSSFAAQMQQQNPEMMANLSAQFREAQQNPDSTQQNPDSTQPPPPDEKS